LIKADAIFSLTPNFARLSRLTLSLLWNGSEKNNPEAGPSMIALIFKLL
jgi:hypothetical protein